jgi:hypothetical protein
MANKIVKIPVSEIDGLRSDGSYKLRYRVKSKDGSRKSDWSEIQTVSFPLDFLGKTTSFYELYVAPLSRPILSNGFDNLNPHPTDPYDISIISAAMGVGEFLVSTISYPQDDSGIYTVSWKYPTSSLIAQNFDVYLSWKTTADGWKDFQYAGTTSSNNFSFKKDDSTAQSVQAAIFLSSYPKLPDAYGSTAEITFVSMTPVFETYQDVGSSTLSTVTTPAAGSGGKYYGTITAINETFPVGCVGRRVFESSGAFADKTITVKSRGTNGGSLTVESSSAFGSSSATTTLTDLRL